mgnify:CR=1 FL=1
MLVRGCAACQPAGKEKGVTRRIRARTTVAGLPLLCTLTGGCPGPTTTHSNIALIASSSCLLLLADKDEGVSSMLPA